MLLGKYFLRSVGSESGMHVSGENADATVGRENQDLVKYVSLYSRELMYLGVCTHKIYNNMIWNGVIYDGMLMVKDK